MVPQNQSQKQAGPKASRKLPPMEFQKAANPPMTLPEVLRSQEQNLIYLPLYSSEEQFLNLVRPSSPLMPLEHRTHSSMPLNEDTNLSDQ